jgi:putative membrane protein
MTLKDVLKTRIARGTAIFGSFALCATVIAAQGQDPHAGRPGQTGTPGSPPTAGTTGPSGSADPSVSQNAAHDSDVLAQLIALDENEVRAAKTAEDKKVDTPILNFARMLHEDHMKDIQATQHLASRLGFDLKSSAAADQLHDKGSQLISRLEDLKGDAFARAYVTEMVNGHREALQMLDDALKSVQRDEVRQHLTAVRATVAMHLRSAEALQTAAGQQKGAEPETGPDLSATVTSR